MRGTVGGNAGDGVADSAAVRGPRGMFLPAPPPPRALRGGPKVRRGSRTPTLEALTPADMPLRFGRYRLTGILGSGGMARVFKAELEGSAGFRKAVALKVIHRSVLQADDKLVRALLNEARLGGLLHHQNIVETYDVGQVKGRHFIALEFVDGITLNRYLEQVGPPPLSACLELGAQMAQGLSAAHKARIEGRPAKLVHRDLKPSNVMLNREGIVKVLDFGIAKTLAAAGGRPRRAWSRARRCTCPPSRPRAAPWTRARTSSQPG